MDEMLPLTAHEWDFYAYGALRHPGCSVRNVPMRRIEIRIDGRLELLMVNVRGYARHYQAPPKPLDPALTRPSRDNYR